MIQRSIKLLLLHLVVHLYYSPTLMMHSQTQIKSNKQLSLRWEVRLVLYVSMCEFVLIVVKRSKYELGNGTSTVI